MSTNSFLKEFVQKGNTFLTRWIKRLRIEPDCITMRYDSTRHFALGQSQVLGLCSRTSDNHFTITISPEIALEEKWEELLERVILHELLHVKNNMIGSFAGESVEAADEIEELITQMYEDILFESKDWYKDVTEVTEGGDSRSKGSGVFRAKRVRSPDATESALKLRPGSRKRQYLH